MKNNIISIILAGAAIISASSCSKFLSEQVPQGQLTDEQINNPAYVDNMVTSAYAIFTSAEDINSSFSLWNFDIRSDDAYKGGSSPSDGNVFHQLEVEKGIDTGAWNINGIWERFYNAISRVNSAIAAVEKSSDSFELKNQRLGELRFLRAYAHFQLKRLFKQIPFVTRTDYTYAQYGEISNTEFTNDEGWLEIIKDLEYAYGVLPATQADKGRPTKAACAAFLAKVFLYKAYHQDTEMSNAITEIREADLRMVLDYTDPMIYSEGGYDLEKDIHNNFRPEEQYENGCESLWAIQYSRNDGSTYGNLNWGYGLIVPNITEVTDGGCDFYKPSQNLVNAFRTDEEGYPLINDFNKENLDYTKHNTDPRLYLTVGMPGLPYMFNENFIMDRSSSWSRSGGTYGYYVTLKHNVDPALIGSYLIHGSYWASSMNRIVFRYADVILMRAEAYAQLGEGKKAIAEVNKIRNRAAASTQTIANYPSKYGVKFYCRPYDEQKGYTREEAFNIVKMERRLELAMESERFFDLVRWGEAKSTLDKYFAEEIESCNIYTEADFTADKNEYLPIPFSQISAANGHYKQNSTQW